ncbi:Uracil-DNA glycosylase [Pelagirhabdus alkalitolerans]|uniref:Uracil-DNA glycosylase n=1 Tax=Pelagirhabdus alkalitolerans TaxID=1612202 RepID=A0A1G6IY70_9BACI|nr:uracil-DNA glycosylase [Pelagirhabdus alkalitolerans]SDC11409.1 Uracil-DNA glycosylase [Pelagirhabdus alkalitolerans]
MRDSILSNDWAYYLNDEFEKEYYQQLRQFLIKEYNEQVVFPNQHDLFNALHYTPYENVKVVILGQDPYHGDDQAHGLSFSVQPHVKVPPSLKNIYKELANDIGCEIPNHGHLTKWAKQGVLLLNAVLSVRRNAAYSHRNKGWEHFTNRVIDVLNQKEAPVVYVLWGAAAQKKKALIDTTKHYIIESSHPSPLAAHRGFFGSQPFSKTNAYLEKSGITPIDWCIPDYQSDEEV